MVVMALVSAAVTAALVLYMRKKSVADAAQFQNERSPDSQQTFSYED
jgi:hypothetical protein